MASLEFEKITPIFENLIPHQASDGTIFHASYGKSTIFVLYNGQKVTPIKSWDGEIIWNCYECFGDALYFKTSTYKIYKATFHPPGKFQVTFIRDLKNGESCNGNMLLSREINGRKVIYRACDDPKNGIIVDV
ncbi:hypothetical protein PFISCL1PPCAC_9171, partial [Pristionchus fissidentatus]